MKRLPMLARLDLRGFTGDLVAAVKRDRADDDSRFVLVESWASQELLDAHMKSPTMGDVGKALGAFIGGAPVMHKYMD